MGKTDPVTQAETLRQLTREANAAVKDMRNAEKTLRDAIAEARKVGPALVEEYLRTAVAERLAEFDATLTALAKNAADDAEAVHAELDRLRDAAARLTPTDTRADDGPGAFPCPDCGARLDAHEHMATLDKPVGTGAGDAHGFTVCAHCGQVIILTTTGGQRRPTGAEETAIRRTPAFRKIETLRSMLDAGPRELDRIRGLIERSSLGTPGAKALRSRVGEEAAARVVATSKRLGNGRHA